MNPHIQKALQHINNANYAGYFEELDKLKIPNELMATYGNLKGIFISGQAPFNFHLQLMTFAREIDKPVSNSQDATLNINNTTGDGNLVMQGNYNTSMNYNFSNDNKPQDILSILYISAQPSDKIFLRSEFDEITKRLYNSDKNRDVEFFPPLWEADYDGLLRNLKRKPTILHYSGHGDKNSIYLMNKITGKTQSLENYELEDIFEGRSDYLKLVFLNSCFSSNQAKIISSFGMYVLGINNQEVDDQVAISFADNFYLGIESQTKPINIQKAIRIGCTNFVKNYPDYNHYISLWKNGKQVDYKNFEPIK